jgi:hypothetical protein
MYFNVSRPQGWLAKVEQTEEVEKDETPEEGGTDDAPEE